MKNTLILGGALCAVGLALAGCSGGGNGTPSKATAPGANGPGGASVQLYTQQERLARPVVNEVLATVAGNRHQVNNTDNPTDDAGQLKNDIEGFLTAPAGRSRATKDFIESVLVPDVMVADLSKTGPAAYLGVETSGAFGGRALTDDVVDTSLGIIFGNTVSVVTSGAVPDDGNEIPTLTSDNVGAGGHTYLNTFPYLGTAH